MQHKRIRDVTERHLPKGQPRLSLPVEGGEPRQEHAQEQKQEVNLQ